MPAGRVACRHLSGPWHGSLSKFIHTPVTLPNTQFSLTTHNKHEKTLSPAPPSRYQIRRAEAKRPCRRHLRQRASADLLTLSNTGRHPTDNDQVCAARLTCWLQPAKVTTQVKTTAGRCVGQSWNLPYSADNFGQSVLNTRGNRVFCLTVLFSTCRDVRKEGGRSCVLQDRCNTDYDRMR